MRQPSDWAILPGRRSERCHYISCPTTLTVARRLSASCSCWALRGWWPSGEAKPPESLVPLASRIPGGSIECVIEMEVSSLLLRICDFSEGN